MRSLALAMIVVAGCGASLPVAPTDGGGGALLLGTIQPTDATSFVPLVDGQDATLVEGGQGGFHVWMKFRARGLPAGDARLTRSAHRLSDGKTVLYGESTITIGAPDGSGAWELPAATPMFMCPAPVGVSILDTPIEFSLAIDAGGARASSEVRLVPRCPPEAASFCAKICGG